MNGTVLNPEGDGPSRTPARSNLLMGKPCKFALEDSDENRTIQADWLKDALTAGKEVNVENAIVVGVLTLRYATVAQEISLKQCEFRGRLDFSYCVFKRNVILTNTSFNEGLNLDSASLEYDLFANGVKGLGDIQAVNLRDVRIGGSLFCDESNFDTSCDCQNLNVGNDGFFRGATFNGTADFSDSKFGGGLLFGSNSAENRSAAKFNGDTDFDRSSVGGNADFEEVTFNDPSTIVRFRNASIAGDVRFSGAVFSGPVSFAHSFSGGRVQFQGTVFRGKATFTGLRVSSSALFLADPSRNLPAPVFEEAARFHDLEVGGRADFSGANFKCEDNDAEIRFDRARIKGNLRFRGCSFSAKLFLYAVQVGGQLSANDGVFKKGVFGSGMKVMGPAFFRGVAFGSAVRFHATHFYENVYFDGARFDGDANFLRATIDGDASFSSEDNTSTAIAAFNSNADFTDARIGGNAEFSKVAFAETAIFDSLSVDKSAFFQDAVFKHGADFTGFHAGQDANFDRVQFRAAGVPSPQSREDHPNDRKTQPSLVTFQGAEILSDASFSNAHFETDTSFEDAIVHGGAYFDAAVFRQESKPSFSGSHFRHGAFFRDASFHDVANFRVTRFGLEARFQGTKFHKRVIFDGAIFEGIAEFRSGEARGTAIPAAVFNDVSFEHARFEQDARFDDTLFRKLAGFRETSLKALYLSPDGYTGRRRRMQFKQGIDFRGCQYDRIQVDWKALLQLGEHSQAAPRILKRTAFRAPVGPRQQPYDRQPYIQLEGALRTSGRTEDADYVYLERRRVERHVRWTKGQYGRWGTDLLFWLGARYGVRPFRLVVFSILLIAAGTWVFSQPSALSAPRDSQVQSGECENNPSLSRALGESLHEFLPVEIPMGSECVPATKPISLEVKPVWVSERLLELVHLHGLMRKITLSISPATFASFGLRLPGWIFVPLGVASLAGLLRRSSTS